MEMFDVSTLGDAKHLERERALKRLVEELGRSSEDGGE